MGSRYEIAVDFDRGSKGWRQAERFAKGGQVDWCRLVITRERATLESMVYTMKANGERAKRRTAIDTGLKDAGWLDSLFGSEDHALRLALRPLWPGKVAERQKTYEGIAEQMKAGQG